MLNVRHTGWFINPILQIVDEKSLFTTVYNPLYWLNLLNKISIRFTP
jgi:hypothetical protein